MHPHTHTNHLLLPLSCCRYIVMREGCQCWCFRYCHCVSPPTHSALSFPAAHRTFLSTSPAISERTELPNGTACCDTSVTVFWDDSIGKYAVFDRIEPLKPPFRGSRGRRIGRCVSS